MSKKVTIELTEEQVREFLAITTLNIIKALVDTYDTFARAIGVEDSRGTENDR